MTLDIAIQLDEEKDVELFLHPFVVMGGTPNAKVVPVAHLETMDVERSLARMDAREQVDWLEPYNWLVF